MLQPLAVSFLILSPQKFPGCLALGGTEIIPVEPDQGNACEGR